MRYDVTLGEQIMNNMLRVKFQIVGVIKNVYILSTTMYNLND